MRHWDNVTIKRHLQGARSSQTFSELMQRYVALRTANAESGSPNWEGVYGALVPAKPFSIGKLREASKKMLDEQKRTWQERAADFDVWTEVPVAL